MGGKEGRRGCIRLILAGGQLPFGQNSDGRALAMPVNDDSEKPAHALKRRRMRSKRRLALGVLGYHPGAKSPSAGLYARYLACFWVEFQFWPLLHGQNRLSEINDG